MKSERDYYRDRTRHFEENFESQNEKTMKAMFDVMDLVKEGRFLPAGNPGGGSKEKEVSENREVNQNSENVNESSTGVNQQTGIPLTPVNQNETDDSNSVNAGQPTEEHVQAESDSSGDEHSNREVGM